MKAFIISPHQDTAGQAARIAKAFKKYEPTWTVRAMRSSNNWLRQPGDLEFDHQKAIKLYAEADVVHHQNGLAMYALLDEGQCKPTVLHHHGTRLRSHPQAVTTEGQSVEATQIVSTVDLLDDCPVAQWIPQPVALEEIEKFRVFKKGNHKRIRIGHAPTNRRAKNTEAILDALNWLSQRYDIEIDLIEGVEWLACLSRKGRCDIFIDQVTLGYGNNAIECMAMGIPVVSGWADPTDRERFVNRTAITPQFVEATAENLPHVLAPLIVSKEIREEWGYRGRRFVELIHDERKVIYQLKGIYEQAKPSTGELQQFIPVKEPSWEKTLAQSAAK